MYGEVELRVMRGRLLEQLTQIERASGAARAVVQDAVYRIDSTSTEPLPGNREMITAVMRAAGNIGLTRYAIIQAVHRDYGFELPPDSATTTLARMRRAHLARRDGAFWFLI